MRINSINSQSFGAYIPVMYYANGTKNAQTTLFEEDDPPSRVIGKTNLRKCNGYIVRNLNGTEKKHPAPGLVKYIKKYDRDYRECPQVHSVYDYANSIVYLVTGRDVDTINQMAKPVGIAKGHSMDVLGHSKSFDAKCAAENFVNRTYDFLKRHCRQVKNKKGERLQLHVYYEPKYTKKGNFDKFEFQHAIFKPE